MAYAETTTCGYAAAAVRLNHPECFAVLPLEEGFRCDYLDYVIDAFAHNAVEAMDEVLKIPALREKASSMSVPEMTDITTKMPHDRSLDWAALMKKYNHTGWMKWFLDYATEYCPPYAVIEFLEQLPQSDWPKQIGLWAATGNRDEAVGFLRHETNRYPFLNTWKRRVVY